MMEPWLIGLLMGVWVIGFRLGWGTWEVGENAWRRARDKRERERMGALKDITPGK